MNSRIADEIVEELASTFQKLETQSAALVEFVKDKGIAKEDDLAPYMERAAAASAVRWRATRVRMARLLASDESGDGYAKESAKAEEQKKSQATQGDEPSKDKEKDKDRMKQAESLATEPVEAEQDRGKQTMRTTEKPAQKSSNRREGDNEKSNVESAGRQQPTTEDPENRIGAADQSSAAKPGQPAAQSGRDDQEKREQETDREKKDDRKNVA